MKGILCSFVILLSIFIYPVLLPINSELLPFWGNIELDLFNWYRMVLVCLMIVPAFWTKQRPDFLILTYLSLLLLSFIATRFPETAIYGTPNHHEGFLALLGYIGIYEMSRRLGFFKGLEKSISIVVGIVFFVALLQIYYGNFTEFPLFKLALPHLQYNAMTWPLYSTMGSFNHLGLFASLLLPYALVKKKWIMASVLAFLLFGSETRGAILSAVITTCLISRKYFIYLMVGALLFCVPYHKRVMTRIQDTINSIHYPVRDNDLDGRAFIWKKTIPVLRPDTLLGSGPATFPIYFSQMTKRGDLVGYKNLVVDRPHNLFFNIWQNTGLLSLVVLGGIALRALILGKSEALKMGVLGFLISGLFTDSVLCVTPYFLIFLGGLTHEYNETRRLSEGAGGTEGALI